MAAAAAKGGGGKPNGAILGGDGMKKQRRQRFDAWAEGYRKNNLPQQKVCFDYSKSPKPGA